MKTTHLFTVLCCLSMLISAFWSVPLCFSESDPDAILREAQSTQDVHKRLELYKEVKELLEQINSDDAGHYRGKYIDVLYSLIKIHLSLEPQISLTNLLQETGFDRSWVSWYKEMDLNGDGINEIFLGNRGPYTDSSNIALAQVDGKVQCVKFGYIWDTDLTGIYSLDKGGKATLFYSSGGNGAGSSIMFLVGYDKGILRELFRTPEANFGGNKLEDFDKDGVKEIICNEKIVYKELYWPIIYKWNGNTFVDISLKYPAYLVDSYNKLELQYRDQIVELLSKRSPQYHAFVTKYLN